MHRRVCTHSHISSFIPGRSSATPEGAEIALRRQRRGRGRDSRKKLFRRLEEKSEKRRRGGSKRKIVTQAGDQRACFPHFFFKKLGISD